LRTELLNLPRARDDDGRAIPGEFVRGEFIFEADAALAGAPDRSDAIFDPAPELRRQQDFAFNQEARASGMQPPRSGPIGGFHSKSLRRLP
jgi:hypothetical protein